MFWFYYLKSLENINVNDRNILKVISSLNIIDRELFFIPQMAGFCIGFMDQEGELILLTFLTIVLFLLNQVTLAIFSNDFSFVKK